MTRLSITLPPQSAPSRRGVRGHHAPRPVGSQPAIPRGRAGPQPLLRLYQGTHSPAGRSHLNGEPGGSSRVLMCLELCCLLIDAVPP